MIVLLLVKPFLLHVHQMPEVDDLANLLLLLRPDSAWPLRVLISHYLHLLLIKKPRVYNRLTRIRQGWLCDQYV
jgi:hypothetical protein